RAGRWRGGVDGGRDGENGPRVVLDQRGHQRRRDTLGQSWIDRAQDRPDVVVDRHVAVGRPDPAEVGSRLVVGAVERRRRYGHARGRQQRFDVRQTTRLVAVVAGRAVEQQRAPEVDGDRLDLHRVTL